MNEQYFEERVNNTDSGEKPDQDTYNLIENPDSFAGQKAPIFEDRFQEPPMGETFAEDSLAEETIIHAGPMDDPLFNKAQLSESIPEESLDRKSVPHQSPMEETIPHKVLVPISPDAGTSSALLNRETSEQLRTRWNEIQGKFVDEPRTAVQQADTLVLEVIEQITQMFTSERSTLESQWKQGDDVSTEDLRQALQRYRSFFNRLVV